LFGTTVDGGKGDWGSIFQVSPAGAERVIGAYPFARLAGAGGKLYGTTQGGGSTGWGTAFSFSP
jgi:uncharacterized repeat protein (TIGR03803 family)